LLAGLGSAASVSAASELTGVAAPLGRAATVAAGLIGPGVATYTAALIANTAVPAWHDARAYLPFVFAASAATAAAGFGLAGAPLQETAPVRRLAVLAGLGELAAIEAMKHGMGYSAGAYRHGKARWYRRTAETLTAAGVLAAAAGSRHRGLSVGAGAALLGGSAFSRFATFHAGITSAEDPSYTVVPQRQRLDARAGGAR
jgi:hypothetical protein